MPSTKTKTPNLTSGDRIRANVKCVVNAKEIRKEERDGRQVMIVPSYTLPDDIVMNNIRYPAEEIEKSYKTLEGTPAPLGHPTVNGMFVSAKEPLGLNIGWFGAWNANVRREEGRVFVEKVIDIERANESKMGRRVLEALDKGEPIHTSTGLLMNIRECTTSDLAEWEGYDMEFDHDAVLLDEQGAATPEQGVGMLVNSQGEEREIEVVNSAIDMAESDLDWAADMAARAIERMERAPLLERIKTAILEVVTGSDGGETSAQNRKEAEMADKQLDQLSEKVNAIEEQLKPENLAKTLGETISNAVTEAIKPVTDHVASLDAANKAKEEEELTGLREQIVKANLLTEDEAKELTLNAARGLAKKAGAKPAPGLFGGMNDASGDTSLAEEWEH